MLKKMLIVSLWISGLSGASWQEHADANHTDYTKPQLTRGRISFLNVEDAVDHKAHEWRPLTPRPTRLSLEQIDNTPIEAAESPSPLAENSLMRARKMSSVWWKLSRTVSGVSIQELVLPTKNERLSQSSVASLSSVESPVSGMETGDDATNDEFYRDED